MTIAWLEELLPHAMLSKRWTVLWIAFFLLFPVAYFAGARLEMIEERPARVEGALDRDMSIRTAQKFAESKGTHVAGWDHYVIVETHEELMAYYRLNEDPSVAECSNLAPGREITVLFRSPNGASEFRTYLSLTGTVTGFDMGKVELVSGNIKVEGATVHVNQSGKDKGEAGNMPKAEREKAVPLAKLALEANPVLSGLVKLGQPSEIEANSADPMRTDISWKGPPTGKKGITLQVSTSVRDAQVVAQRITANLDEDFEKSKLQKKPRFPVVFNSIYAIFLILIALYAIFRYAKRTIQKEVSHSRTLVVATLFSLSCSIYAYSLLVDQIAMRLSAAQFSKAMLPSAGLSLFVFVMLGLLVGMGYSSGEGEVREAFPGKLTSLDALLAGRIFSRNVAASILFGAAAAGWLMFVQHGIGYFVKQDMLAAGNDGLHYTFARQPWLTLLAGRQYESLLIAVAGLLLPAAFLVRSKAKGNRRYIWLLLFAVCAVLHDAAGYSTLPSALLAVGVLTSGLLLPFFAFDLLAAMVSLSALAFVNELARLSAIFPTWIEFALWLGGFGTVGLAIAAYAALHGRPVRDEDVRPLYAKHLAERLGLQAEVSAAREAQLRLMPQVAPQTPGVEFAACCLPAKVVGGDFYDFFPLDGGRIGIFVAQGNEGGLGSALCIALAKGVLMHASQQTNSALQVALQLEAEMPKLLRQGSGTKIPFVYGVFDPRRQVLNYARVGDSPRVLLHQKNRGIAEATQFEQRATFPGRTDGALPIHEGAVILGAGDHLVFFTDGVTSIRVKRLGSARNQWIEFLMQELGKTGEPIQNTLVASLSRYHSKVSKDLTAVVLRTVASETVAQEGVA